MSLKEIFDKDLIALCQSDLADLMGVSRATIRNWLKGGYIECVAGSRQISVQSVREFCSKIVGTNKLVARANKLYLDSHDHDLLSADIVGKLIDLDEAGFRKLSAKYEASLSGSYRNKQGIYYTPLHIVREFFQNLSVDFSQAIFCDPCCGTGNFLVMALEVGFQVHNIYGFDIDAVAVKVAQLRMQKLSGTNCANISELDFLSSSYVDDNEGGFFDLICTNPPWGAKTVKGENKGSSDSSAKFFVAALRAVKMGGIVGMLLPDAFLNVGRFQKVRNIIFQHRLLECIDFGRPFKELLSGAKGLKVQRLAGAEHQTLSANLVRCVEGERMFYRSQDSFRYNPKMIINIGCSDHESRLLDLIRSFPHVTLHNKARWGLGIVTGNNKSFVREVQKEGDIPVWRGSDITREGINEPSLFIAPDFSLYQQVAPVELYFAPEKLLYRFISRELIFYCDREKRVCLNSANLLVVSDDFPVSMSRLAQYFNLPLISWLFGKVFNTHKVLRTDLEYVPILHEYISGADEGISEDGLRSYLGIG